MINQELKLLIEEIKSRYNLIDYIKSKGIEMHKKSSNQYFISCPFHNEKTPSLCVNDHGNDSFFHCFGCGANGDVITFYAMYDNITIGKAIHTMGKGIDITIDLESVVNMMGKEQEEDSEQEISNYNIDVSRFLFLYLSQIRKYVDKDILWKEFDEVESVYQKLDKCVSDGDLEGVVKIHSKICESNFIPQRLLLFKNEE